MYHIIYLSSAIELFSQDELLGLLKKSRKYNSEHNITGCLFYKDGNFLQVIEGEKAAIESLFEKISSDSRHRGIITLFKEDIPDREFPQWEMAFHNFSNNLEGMPEGFLNIFSTYPKPMNLDKYSDKIKAFLKLYI